MPPLRLTSLLQTAFPDLSKPGRAVVNTLACLNGHPPSAAETAAWVGLRDRYQLGRLLRRDGLPSFERLAGLSRVIYWISEAETTGASLLELARREQTHPAAAYRLVRRVLGTCWSQARAAGVAGALLRLREARQRRIVGAPSEAGGARATPRILELRPVPPVSTVHAAGHDVPQHPDGVLGERVVVGDGAFDVAITSSGLALVTCAHAATIDVIGLRPFRRWGAIQTGAVPTRVRPSPSGDWAYVTSQFAEEVGVIDLRTGLQAGTIPIAGHALGAALAPDGRTLYVTSNIDRLYAVAVGPRRVITSAPIPMGSPQVAIHPAGHRVYVSGFKTGTITECDASSLRVVRTLQTGGITQDIVVTPGGTALYAANESGWVDVFALGTGRRITRIATKPALGLALSPDGSVLLVSHVFHGAVSVFDAQSFQLRATLRTEGKPRLMAFDRSGRVVLVANEAGWVDQVV